MNYKLSVAPLVVISLCFFISGCSTGVNTSNATSSPSVTATASPSSSSTSGTASPTTSGGGTFTLTSTALLNGGAIPTKHASTGITGGQNLSIPLAWTNKPSGTQSFALSMVDISASNFVHWLITNIPSSTTSLSEGISNTLYTQYTNDALTIGYFGPEPPAMTGTHTYVITIYALNSSSISFADNPVGANLAAFNSAISGKILSQATISGTFAQ